MTSTAPRNTARELKELLIRTSPLIERYTAAVCPSCTEICCRQRHGTFTDRDRAYLEALGEPVPQHDAARPPVGPCQFLGPGGCAKPRWQRAWKCTWFFCGPLLQALNDGPRREERILSADLAEMVRLYDVLERGGNWTGGCQRQGREDRGRAPGRHRAAHGKEVNR
jgi:hypothetical protein